MTESMAINKRVSSDKFLTISTGSAPTNSEGIKNVNTNLVAPWNAPPWNKVGVIKSSNNPLVTEFASVKRKLAE